jgi:hypothetical protein
MTERIEPIDPKLDLLLKAREARFLADQLPQDDPGRPEQQLKAIQYQKEFDKLIKPKGEDES